MYIEIFLNKKTNNSKQLKRVNYNITILAIINLLY